MSIGQPFRSPHMPPLPPQQGPALPKGYRTEVELVGALIDEVSKNKEVEQGFKDKLVSLGQLLQKEPTNKSEALKEKTISLLDHLVQSTQEQGFNPEKIDQIHRTLLRVQNLIKGSTIEAAKAGIPKIDCEFVFFCDIGCPDSNGACTNSLVRVFESKTPFITTKSIFLASAKDEYELPRNDKDKEAIAIAAKDDKIPKDKIIKENRLIREGVDWIIFQQVHPEHGTEFLIFLPKSSLPPNVNDMKEQDILEHFDLKLDGTLKRITPLEAFTPPERKASYTGFTSLFSDDPKHAKLFFITGHGGHNADESSAGLSSEDYAKFIYDFLPRQKCRGLATISCYSGGEKSLLHQGNKAREKGTAQALESDPVTFPVILHSLGDFPVTWQATLDDMSAYFKGIAQLQESGKGETAEEFKKILRTLEAGKNIARNPKNYTQVYFPPAKDSPGGFRTVGEGGHRFSLSYASLQRTILQAKFTHAIPEIVVDITTDKRNIFEVHPIVVDIPLVFPNKSPVLVSMIPGNAHHYIREIRLGQETPKHFLEKNGLFFQEKELATRKVFLIQKLSSGNRILEDVAVYFDKSGMVCMYQEDGKYYKDSQGQNAPTPISAFTYGMKLQIWVTRTESSPLAIRSHTGGQQNEETFQKILQENHFENILNEEQTNELVNLLSVLDEKLSSDDQALLVNYLLAGKREDLLQRLIEKGVIFPNLLILEEPLIFHALRNNHNQLFEFLLTKIEDVETLCSSKMDTLLHVAVQKGNVALVSRLLNLPKIEIGAYNASGIAPIALARDIEMLKLFQQKGGINPYHLRNLLSDTCHTGTVEKVKELLDFGADQGGTPSPLDHALLRADPEMVNLLLDHGANPFLKSNYTIIIKDKDLTYPMPIIEAMRRCPEAIVRKMLNHPGFGRLSPSEKSEILMGALEVGNMEYIRLLMEKGVELPSKKFSINTARMRVAEDYSLLIGLFQQKQAGFLFESMAKSDPDLLRELISSKQIDFDPPKFFLNLINLLITDFKKHEWISTLMKERGFDISDHLEPTHLAQAVNAKNADINLIKLMISSLVARQIDLNKPVNNLNLNCASTVSPMDAIIYYGKTELIDFCLTLGVKIDFTEEKLVNPMKIVANIKGNDRIAMFRKLLEFGAAHTINQEDTFGPPLLTALRKGDAELTKLFLENGATLSGNNYAVQACKICLETKNSECLELVLKSLPPADLQAFQDFAGIIPIFLEAKIDVLRVCFQYGFKLTNQTLIEKAFECAIDSGNLECLHIYKENVQRPSTEYLDNGQFLARAYCKGGPAMFDEILADSLNPQITSTTAWRFVIAIIKNQDRETLKKIARFKEFYKVVEEELKKHTEFIKWLETSPEEL